VQQKTLRWKCVRFVDEKTESDGRRRKKRREKSNGGERRSRKIWQHSLH
jgi:hypothetical protein